MNMLEALSDNIKVDPQKCTTCGICVERCIMDNLRLKLSPCRQACPLGVNCQGYVQLIVRGSEKDALSMVEQELPFPGILGRLCSAPCEQNCHRKKIEGEAVAIRALKRYLSDLAGDGDHYAANVVSASFKGKTRVQQHQMVYAALKGGMGNELHALALRRARLRIDPPHGERS